MNIYSKSSQWKHQTTDISRTEDMLDKNESIMIKELQ